MVTLCRVSSGRSIIYGCETEHLNYFHIFFRIIILCKFYLCKNKRYVYCDDHIHTYTNTHSAWVRNLCAATLGWEDVMMIDMKHMSVCACLPVYIFDVVSHTHIKCDIERKLFSRNPGKKTENRLISSSNSNKRWFYC